MKHKEERGVWFRVRQMVQSGHLRVQDRDMA